MIFFYSKSIDMQQNNKKGTCFFISRVLGRGGGATFCRNQAGNSVWIWATAPKFGKVVDFMENNMELWWNGSGTTFLTDTFFLLFSLFYKAYLGDKLIFKKFPLYMHLRLLVELVLKRLKYYKPKVDICGKCFWRKKVGLIWIKNV